MRELSPEEQTKREERLAYGRAWRAAHPLAKQQWGRKNKDHVSQYNHQYGTTNRSILREKERVRDRANRETVNAKQRAYTGKNRTKINANQAARRLDDVERYRNYDRKRAGTPARKAQASTSKHRRRAKIAGAAINDLTAAQWREIQEAHDHRCVYCGKRRKGHLTQDHLTPISKGGNHTASNVVPACSSCNSRKLAGPVLKPVQPMLLTMAPARKKKVS